MKIYIIMGSTRPERKNEAITQWLYSLAKNHESKDITFEIIDLRDYPLPFYNEPVGASQLASVGYSNEVAKRWAEKIEAADGFIIVTPEYNHGYSAVLKNAIDYVYDGWNKKPVAFVSYGGPAGGSRAIEQLRQVAIELQMHPVREQVTIPYIWSALSDSGELIDEGEHFKHGAESMIRQLMAYTTLFSSFRKQAIN